MRKWRILLSLLSALLLLPVLLPSPVAAQGGRFWLQAQGDNAEAVTGTRVIVFTAGALTLPTIYTSATLATAASNPLSCNSTTGVCEWWMPTSTTTVDAVLIVDSGPYKGEGLRVDALTRSSVHMVKVNRSSGMKRAMAALPSAASTDRQSATQTLNYGSTVMGVQVQTTTVAANSRINVALAEQPDAALCDNVPTTAAGIQSCRTDVGGAQPRVPYTVATSGGTAISVHNQNHAPGGFVWIFYLPPANE